MGQKFPNFKLRKMKDGRLAWVGELKPTGLDGNVYKVIVIYPEEFLHKAPLVYPIESAFEKPN